MACALPPSPKNYFGFADIVPLFNQEMQLPGSRKMRVFWPAHPNPENSRLNPLAFKA
jgi:hypothetical protein